MGVNETKFIKSDLKKALLEIPIHVKGMAARIDQDISYRNELINDLNKSIIQINKEIAIHTDAISALEKEKKQWIDFSDNRENLIQREEPLNRPYIRSFLNAVGEPVQTNKIIDWLYPISCKEEEKRTKLIRQLSVMLNQMEKRGEIEITKKEGVKGNFYKMS